VLEKTSPDGGAKTGDGIPAGGGREASVAAGAIGGASAVADGDVVEELVGVFGSELIEGGVDKAKRGFASVAASVVEHGDDAGEGGGGGRGAASQGGEALHPNGNVISDSSDVRIGTVGGVEEFETREARGALVLF